MSKMYLSTVINALFLCLFNIAFMIAGIFLNSVVIISLLRSSKLGKKLCYFMIFVLSCFDLAVVAIVHPLQISSTISVSLEKYNDMQKYIRFYIGSALTGFSMLALFVLNIERFLALKCPFFHQTSVTKQRLFFLLVALMILCTIGLSFFRLNIKILANWLSIVNIPVFLLLFIYINYKMFIIARSKQDNETLPKSRYPVRKRAEYQLKTFSTCSLTAICYFICSCPYLVYSALRLSVYKNASFEDLVFYHLWNVTVLCVNSTFNCLIFFWKNSILRREGINTIKHFRATRFCRGWFSNEVLPKER